MTQAWEPGAVEEAVRLISIVALHPAGRAYLIPNAVPVLLSALSGPGDPPGAGPGAPGSREGGKDDRLQQRALAGIQRISLSRGGQSIMIESGVLPWIVEWLKDLEAVGRLLYDIFKH